MSRPNRSTQRDHVWHVMSRGVRQTPIFLSDKQRLTFIDILKWAVETTAMDIISFILMDNHFHLLADGPGERLGKLMQLLMSVYAREFNKTAGTSGHLFQGRYRAYPAKSDAWIASRALYIHLNPVEAGLVDDPMQYRWSSLKGYLGAGSLMPLLKPEKVLRLFGNNVEQQRANYLEHIRLATRQCAANSQLAESVLKNNGTTLHPEEIRLQVYETVRLLRRLEDALKGLRQKPAQLRETSHQLGAYLGREMNIAYINVMAVVLGCSVSTAWRLIRRGKQLADENPELRALLDGVRTNLQIIP